MVRRHRHAVPALIAAFLLGLVTIVPAAANNTAQTLPFTQDWTNTNQITSADNWSGVPGIQGFQRPGHPTTTGDRPADAARRLTRRQGPRCDPEPDQPGDHQRRCRPNSSLPNPVVALQASATADAPYLLFHLDTTGASQHAPSRTTCATSTRPATTRSSRSPSSTASAPAAASRTSLRVRRRCDDRRCRNAGHARCAQPCRPGRQPAARPGPRDDHERAGNDEWVGIDDILRDRRCSVGPIRDAGRWRDRRRRCLRPSPSRSTSRSDLAAGAINVMCAGTPIDRRDVRRADHLDLRSGRRPAV